MFLVLFFVLPLLELYVFVQLAGALGFGTALLAGVGATLVGVWLVKQQGLGVLRRANAKVVRGEEPTDEVVNGTLLLLAGILLLLPGFVTGAAGLLLLLPPVRVLLRRSLRTRFATGPIVFTGSSRIGPFVPGTGFGGPGPGLRGRLRGDVLDADSWEEPTAGPDRPELP